MKETSKKMNGKHTVFVIQWQQIIMRGDITVIKLHFEKTYNNDRRSLRFDDLIHLRAAKEF